MFFVIKSFADETTADLFAGDASKAARRIPKTIWPVARRKLDLLDRVRDLRELVAPGFRLEKLKGDRAGYYSIRVNDQYRIVFAFATDGARGEARDVQITDYH